MALGARLARLEEKAARVIRCAWCRVSLIDDYQQKARGRTVTTDFVMRSCPFCGNEFKVGLEGLTARERESFVLWAYTYSGETYRDARAYAAEEWWTARSWVRILTEPERYRAALAARTHKPNKPDKYALERAELKAEAERMKKAEMRRQRRVYGPRTFPLVATLRGLKEGLKDLDRQPYTPGFVYYPPAEKTARMVLIYARCMEACEVVLWGVVEEATAAEIEARAAEVASFDEARAEAAAVKEREAAERLRQEEERRAERERERAAREGFWDAPVRTPENEGADWLRRLATQNETAPPRSRFRKDGATASPEAARIVRFPDEALNDGPGFQSPPEDAGPPARRYYRGPDWDGDPRY